jgi:gamma-glutamyltranspeptidase/glutathione hydrolase
MRFPLAVAWGAVLAPGCRDAPPATPRAVVTGPPTVPADWALTARARAATSRRAMVVSGHPAATRAGTDVLELGGNAVDAAVAVAFALAVVLPEAGNLGGGGFAVLRNAAGEVSALDFRETAPARATPDLYLDAAGRRTDASVRGHLASGVPGTVAGLAELHRRFGHLPWTEVLAPAISLAGSGHWVDSTRAALLAEHADKLRAYPASRAQFLPDDAPPPVGTLWRQPDLARTLSWIARNGPDAFYQGPIASLIVAEMERGGGVITAADLAAYRARWRRPLVLTYRGHTIYTPPPPSGGGVMLAILLNLMEWFDTLPPFGSVSLLDREAAAMREAIAVRQAYLGDPGFGNVPTARLVDKDYAAGLRPTLGRRLPGSATDPHEGTETIHIAVVDSKGTAVSLTTTINNLFGSGVTVTGAGFLLNDEMDDFALTAGRGAPNALAPGKRMLSSMTPAIVLDRAGALRLVVGARGGTRIPPIVYRVITNLLDHGMTLPDAVAAPRARPRGRPDSLELEEGGVQPRDA